MIYTVQLDGTDIYDLTKKNKVLISPKLTLELNSAGSCEFTMPPMHESYEKIKPVLSVVKVMRGDKILFAGRPMEETKDFYKDDKVYCEGLLALLNDTYYAPHDTTYKSIQDMLQTVLDSHNAQKTDYTFKIAKCTVTNRQTLYRDTGYMSCWDFIKNQIIAAEGGYLYADYSQIDSKIINIYYLSALEKNCNQPIKFGLNMLDYTYGLKLQDLATCVLAYAFENGRSATGQYTTDTKYIDSGVIESPELVKLYGKIVKIVMPQNVDTEDGLKEYARRYLNDLQYDMLSITGKAADLFSINPNYEDFEIGMNVEVVSEPHGIDKWYPLTKVEISLDSAEQAITVGSQNKQSLTSMQNRKNDELDNKTAVADTSTIENDISELSGNYDTLSSDVSDLNSRVDTLEQGGTGGDGIIHMWNGKQLGNGDTISFTSS